MSTLFKNILRSGDIEIKVGDLVSGGVRELEGRGDFVSLWVGEWRSCELQVGEISWSYEFELVVLIASFHLAQASATPALG